MDDPSFWREIDRHPDTLVLCSNSRLAPTLTQRHNQWQASQGRRNWPTLNARPIQDWLGDLHQALNLRGLADHPLLQAQVMTPAQEHTLWEAVIDEAQGEDVRGWLDLGSLAPLAMQAHELHTLWGLPDPGADAPEGFACFGRWQRDMLARSAALGLVDRPRLHMALLTRVLAQRPCPLPLPPRVVWVGFIRTTPLEDQLRAHLQQLGVAQRDGPTAPAAAQVQRHRYADSAAECLAVAQWAQQRHADHPDWTLGVVVPDLGRLRHPLEDALQDVLDPLALAPGHATGVKPYNFSLGRPLADDPLVHSALLLLEVATHANAVPHSTISQLLRSPYVWGQRTWRRVSAQQEVRLRERVGPLASLDRFVQAMAPDADTPIDGPHRALVRALAALQQLAADADARAPSAWAQRWQRALTDALWLDAGDLPSHAFQARQKFLDVLHSLGSLDTLTGALAPAPALALLRRLCAQTIFQPQTEGTPWVQILGLLEASGLRWDATWVMGLTDQAWPPAPNPNPLLPVGLQRQHQLPNASADAQWAFARAVHAQLLSSAPQVVLSCPTTADGAALDPSPLLTDGTDAAPTDATPNPMAGIHHPTHTDPDRWCPPLADHFAPPLAPGEPVRGGSSVLRAQAICPAWAYFEFRLQAKALEEPSPGLDARQKGTLLHQALAHFWRTLRTQEALKALSEQALAAQVALAVDAALDAHAAQYPTALAPRARALEAQRLRHLLHQWLPAELSRPSTFEVIRLEDRETVSVGGLSLHVTPDRIDRIATTDATAPLVVVDYKTGAQIDIKNWAGARLTEPQLPLYAACAQSVPDPAGVVFAQVRRKQCGWKGLVRQPDWVPKALVLGQAGCVKVFPPSDFPNWAAVMQHWRQALETVAQEVCRGLAVVRFDDAQALQHCPVRPLLRLPERQAQWQQRTTTPPHTTGTPA